MNTTIPYRISRTAFVVPQKEEDVWTDATNQRHKEISRTALFVNLGIGKYRRVNDNVAVKEKKATRSATATLTADQLMEDPKWRTEVIVRSREVVEPAKTRVVIKELQTYWAPSLIAYYGVRFNETHNPSFYFEVPNINLTWRPQIIYSNEKTPATPYPIAIQGNKILAGQLTAGRHDQTLSASLKTIIENEKANQKVDDPDITAYFKRQTILFNREETHSWVPNEIYRSIQSRREEVVYPMVFLTDCSTTHKTPSVNKPVELYEDREWGNHRDNSGLLRNLEETRQMKMELKKALAEKVYEPERLRKFSEAYKVEFDEYISVLAGE